MPHVIDLIESPDQAIIITPGTQTLDRGERFERACQVFPQSKVEMDEAGNLIVTPGNSGDSSYRSGEAFFQLALWTRQDATGRAFDATGNFNLPSGAKRQPDAAWVPKSVLAQQGHAKLKTISRPLHVPVFLIEVTSPSDRLSEQQDKCREWIQNGVQEAFLVHPKSKFVYVFRPSADMLDIPEAVHVLSAVLPGFVLDCRPIWEDLF